MLAGRGPACTGASAAGRPGPEGHRRPAGSRPRASLDPRTPTHDRPASYLLHIPPDLDADGSAPQDTSCRRGLSQRGPGRRSPARGWRRPGDDGRSRFDEHDVAGAAERQTSLGRSLHVGGRAATGLGGHDDFASVAAQREGHEVRETSLSPVATQTSASPLSLVRASTDRARLWSRAANTLHRVPCRSAVLASHPYPHWPGL